MYIDIGINYIESKRMEPHLLVLQTYSWLCVQSHMECLGLNSGQLRSRKAPNPPYILYCLCPPTGIYL